MVRPIGNAHFDVINDTEEKQAPVFEPQFHCGFCDEDTPVSLELEHYNGRCIRGIGWPLL